MPSVVAIPVPPPSQNQSEWGRGTEVMSQDDPGDESELEQEIEDDSSEEGTATGDEYVRTMYALYDDGDDDN